MARRRSGTARPARAWGVIGPLALAAAALGYVGVAQSLAYRLRNSDPARAHALAPWDGRITAALSKKLLTPDADPKVRERSIRYGREALRQDATAVAAASTLGINAQLSGDIDAARRLVGYAETLSRRDLPTQIWLIEDAVSRGDVAGALRHYDIALRTSPGSSDLLFPILTQAMVDPTVRQALVKTLAAGPSWAPLFAEYAAASSPDARAAAHLFAALARAGRPVAPLPRVLLVDTLVSRGQVDDAWRYYASFRPGADRRRSRDPSFAIDPGAATMFDWRIGTETGIAASIQQGLLDFAAPSSVGGVLVTQLQVLPPGRYRMTGHSIGIDQSREAAPYWKLSCRGGRELGRLALPASSTAGGNFEGGFDVPGDCPVQVLELVAPASDDPSGVTGQIDRVELAAARRTGVER